MLRTAVEWDVIDRVPCTDQTAESAQDDGRGFYDFAAYQRLVESARTDDVAHLDRAARRRRSGPPMRRDHGARVVQRRPAEAAALRRPGRMEGARDDAERGTAAVRAVDPAAGRGATRRTAPARQAGTLPPRRQVGHAEDRPGRPFDGPPDGQTSHQGFTSSGTRSARTWRCGGRQRGRIRSSPDIRTCRPRSDTCI